MNLFEALEGEADWKRVKVGGCRRRRENRTLLNLFRLSDVGIVGEKKTDEYMFPPLLKGIGSSVFR